MAGLCFRLKDAIWMFCSQIVQIRLRAVPLLRCCLARSSQTHRWDRWSGTEGTRCMMAGLSTTVTSLPTLTAGSKSPWALCKPCIYLTQRYATSQISRAGASPHLVVGRPCSRSI
ncbi:hypothetical protein BV20DRAFT_871319 [Pilatotrama ljubarskyi]|nr:hypothetical protein BV20DRAFT_871319 [Pilatotrama ljubarskyi]